MVTHNAEMGAPLMLSYYFTLELFSQAQDSCVLDLLRFPALPLLPPDLKRRLRFTSEGKSTATTSKSIEHLLAAARKQPLNKTYFSQKFVPFALDDLRLVSIQQEMKVSPTSSVWQATARWSEERKHVAHNEYNTLGSREDVLAINAIERFPTTLTTVFELEGSPARDRIYAVFVPALVACLQTLALPLGVTGGGGIETVDKAYGKFGLVTLIPTPLNFTSHWARALPLIGERFGVLQPVMLGSPSLCAGLQAALGDGAAFTPIHAHLALLRLPEAWVRSPDIIAKAAPWLVPTDETTANKKSRPYVPIER